MARRPRLRSRAQRVRRSPRGVNETTAVDSVAQSIRLDCRQVREWISMRIDDELGAADAERVAVHVARCVSCRRFFSDATHLERVTRLAPVEVVPDLTVAIFAQLSAVERVAPGARGRERGRRAATGARTIARWAAAVVPLAVAVPVLSLGGVGHVQVASPHATSPCTARLVATARPSTVVVRDRRHLETAPH